MFGSGINTLYVLLNFIFTMVLQSGANSMFMLKMKPVRLREGYNLPLVTQLRDKRPGGMNPTVRLHSVILRCLHRRAVLCS